MDRADKKIFGTLFFSIFTAVTGVGIVVPLLPVYAHDMGASGMYIGLIFGAFSLSRTFFLPFFGRSSDKIGRKPYIVIGLLCYTLISFAFLAAISVEILIAIRFVQGIASAMIMPVTQAYVGEITPEKREGVTMGIFNMSTFIGLSLGPLIGGVLNDRFDLRIAFISMGILSAVGFFLSLVLLPPTRSERIISRSAVPVTWTHLFRDRIINGLFIFRFVYTACIGIIWGFLPVFADSEFSLSSSAIGVLVMLGVLTSGLLQTPMGYLADRGNKRLMILFGGVIVGYAMFTFERAAGFWDLFAANIFFGIGGSIAMAPLMAIAVRKGAQKGAMGSVMALMTMAHSMGMMIGAFLAGALMDLLELRQTFFFGELVMLAGTGLFFLCMFSAGQTGDEI
ncbi:MFS transporter [Desulfonema ishimotonii]|uniref:MFS transporter n=1 Tax=Desulfonema ishimotonii TaxID=45657 RepID=A0A401G394_9BACT|nr:MFS transporter [Desulfonema ishimotonii]GBC63663.1 MFS transporter [Desulfonema ishimotonii]